MTRTSKIDFFLIFLVALFALKGLVFSTFIPFFQHPDEQIHFGTIEYRAEPREKTWPVQDGSSEYVNDMDDITTFHFSEEVIRSALLSQFDTVKWQKENTQEFSDTSTGIHEEDIMTNRWKRYIDVVPSNASGTQSFYYSLGSKIETLLGSESFFVRFFSLRFLSVLLGCGVIILTYLTARQLSFSPWQSNLIALLVAFQPMFSATASQINIDIALVFSFSLFIYAAISLLKQPSLRSYFFLFSATILGLYSKGPGIVLVVITIPLLLYGIHEHFPNTRQFLKKASIFLALTLLATVLFVPHSYFSSVTNSQATSKFASPIVSLEKYTEKTLRLSEFQETHASYWGYFGWLDTKISETLLRFIWFIEGLALLGIVFLVCSKNPPSYLPEKKYLFFALGIIITLQCAIRFYDWRVFDATGKILIGTPGRYFLPNIIPHIVLLVSGLGFFTKNKKQFQLLLKILSLFMVLLSLYTLFDVIIPRYYL